MQRFTDLEAHSRHGAGMVGDLGVIGVPGVLQLCHLSRLSGVLTAEDAGRLARLSFQKGEVVGAECGEAQGEEAVFDFLGWDGGRFEFAPGGGEEGEPLAESFDRLLLEGCRRLDEAQRASS